MTKPLRAVFAIPGDMHRRTGGFIYESRILAELRDLGHDIAHLQLPASFPCPSPADIEETVSLLRSVPPDRAILLDGFIPGTIGASNLAGLAAPVIPIIHHPLGLETGLPEARAAFLLKNERAALRHATRIVVPSRHTARILTGRFGLDEARIDVAPPGFDPVDGLQTPLDPPLILSVGILAARKGHDVLLDALARLVDLDWQAQIVGGTHDEAVAAALHNQARTLGLSPRVTFRGVLPGSEVRETYGQATIFALATRYEGYGMVFGEAMQRGLPIVTSRAGAVPDTVGTAARLVPVDDPAALASALRELLTDPQSYAALAAESLRAGRALPTWRDTAAHVERTVRTALSDALGQQTQNSTL